MKKFKMKNLGILIGIIAIVIIMLVGVANELVTYTTQQTRYAAKDTSGDISETITSQLAGSTEIANSIAEDESMKKVKFKKTLEMDNIAFSTAVGETESSMSTIVKASSKKYLFGGTEDISWTSAYTGGTNPGVGSASLSPYLQINTWGTWTGYEIKSESTVDLSEYSTLVFEVVSTSGIGGYGEVYYGTETSYINCTTNGNDFKLSYDISSLTSGKIRLTASNCANITVKAIYLEQSSEYTGGEINTKVTVNAKDEFMKVGDTYQLAVTTTNLDTVNCEDLNLSFNDFVMSSSDTTVATVNTEGMITANKQGEAVIKLYNSTYKISFNIKIKVVNGEINKEDYNNSIKAHRIFYSSFDDKVLKEEISNTNYTVNGTICNSIDQVKYGTGSAYFSGNAGQMLRFDKDELNFGTKDFTIEFWTYAETQVVGYPCWISDEQNANFQFFTRDGECSGNMSIAGNPRNTRILNIGKPYTANQWMKYRIVRNQGVFTVYENDIIIATMSNNKTMNVDLSNLAIGGNSATSATVFKGYIDDLSIYDVALDSNIEYKSSVINPTIRVGEKLENLEIETDKDAYLLANMREFSMETITWTSLDEDIATVDNTGVVTGISSGIANIIATDTVTEKSIAIKVKVLSVGDIAQPKISGGWNHFAALKSNGTVWTWGLNNYGQLGNGTTTNVTKPTQVAIEGTYITDAIDVECVAYTTFILRNDGTVWASGNNHDYQLADGTTNTSTVFKKIDGLEGIIEISACHANCYGLKSDGTVWSWGWNGSSQLGRSTSGAFVGQMSVVSNIIQISANWAGLMMLDANGTVWGVGNNENGQFGNGTTTSSSIPVVTTIGEGRVKEMAEGYYHTVFLMDDGTIYTVGYNNLGQLGNGNTTSSSTPIKIDTISNAKHVYAEGFSTYITRNQSDIGENQGMYVVGCNSNGVLFNNSTTNITTFENTQTDKDIISITNTTCYTNVGTVTGAMVDSSGNVYTVGYNANYEMGDQTTVNKTVPTLIGGVKIETTEKIINLEKIGDTKKIGYSYNIDFNLLYSTVSTSNIKYTSLDTSVVTVSEDGTITAVSTGSAVIRIYDSINGVYSAVRVKVNGEGNIAQPKIVGGWNYFAALKSDGTVWTWGYNNYGQLGNGTTANVTNPTQVAIEGNYISDAIDVTCVAYTTYILRTDGTVWASGFNGEYQLADGTNTVSTVFKKIDGLEGIIEISACHMNCYALKSDGTVWSWGSNGRGQLGRSTSGVNVGQMSVVSNIIQISAGWAGLTMLDANGNVLGVGNNENGEFGNGTTTSSSIPVATTIGEGRVKEIAQGEYHTVFLMDDGTVYTTGYNKYSQLGNGNTTSSLTPIKIDTISNVKHVYAKGFSTYITKNKSDSGENQGMYVVGCNSNGILFNNSTSNITTFENIQTDKDIISITNTTCYSNVGIVTGAMVDSNGNVYTVGYNANYEMGDQTTVNKTVPVLIGGKKLSATEKIINLEKIGDTKKIGYSYNIDFNLLYSTVSTSNIKYTSLDTSVVTVSEDGTITAVSTGSAVIRIYDSINGVYSAVRVKVNGEGNIAQPKIVGGWNYFAALKSNGTVWTWGLNNYGQLGNGTTTNVMNPTQVAIEGNYISDAIDVTCVAYTTYILRTDGTVWASGFNGEYQLADGTKTVSTVFKKIDGLEGIIEISSCHASCYALKSDGTVWSWGWNGRGQLGRSTSGVNVGQMSVVSNIIQISAGWAGLTMLDANGNVWGVGNNEHGEFGNGTITSSSIPVATTIGEGRVKEIAEGEYHTVFLMDDGTVYTTGYNNYSQLGNGNTTSSSTPIKIDTISNAKHVYAKGFSTYITKNKSDSGENQGMYVVGCNSNGILFNNSTTNITTFENTQTDKDIISITNTTCYNSIGTVTGAMVDSNGNVYTVGYNANYEMGDQTTVNKTMPVLIGGKKLSATEKIINLEKIGDTEKIGYSYNVGFNLLYDTLPYIDCTYTSLDPDIATVDSQGNVTAKSMGTTIIKLYSSKIDCYASVKINVVGEGNIAQPKIVAGTNHFVALKANGTVWTWGKNNYGQLGLGNITDTYKPKQTELNNVIDIACAGDTTFALKTDGTVWACGENRRGQLADKTPNSSTTFKQIQNIEGIIQIAAHNFNCYALDSDGNVWSWGDNSNGQLGSTSSNLPEMIKNIYDIIQIEAGNNFVIMLDSDGSIWGLGNNSYGQFGDNTTTSTNKPTKVINLLDRVKEIAVGGYHTVMLLENGDVYQCGYNGIGQLGDGTTNNATLPIKVEGIENAKHIYASENGTYITKDSGMYVIGENKNSQLFTGDKQDVNTSKKVLTDKNIFTVASTTYGTGAIATENGDVYTVGYSGYGEIGDGSTTSSTEPINISDSMLEVDKIRVILNLGNEKSSHSIKAATNSGFNLRFDAIENEKINFRSLDTDIATVTPDGIISAQAVGETHIEVIGAISKFRTMVSVEVLDNGQIATPKIVSSDDFTIALKADGTVWSYGCNSDGQLGLGDTDDRYKPTKVNIENIIDIAVGGKHVLLLSDSGKVYSFGLNSCGQLGRTRNSDIPELVEGLNDIVRIEAGENSSMALSNTGKVYTWGLNNCGQLGNGKTTNSSVPQEIKSYRFIKIAMGGNSAAGIDLDNNAYVWGQNTNGQLGKENVENYNMPTRIQNISNVKDIKLGNNNSVILDNDGHVWTTGTADKLGDDSTENRTVFGKVVSETDNTKDLENIKKIRLSNDTVIAVKNDNTAVVWGLNTNKQYATGTVDAIKTPYALKYGADKNIVENIFDITAGNGTISFANSNGEVWTIGKNDCGQLGNKTTTDADEFQCIGGLNVEFKHRIIVLKGINDIAKVEAIVAEEFNLFKNETDNYDLKYSSLNTEIVTVTENSGIVTAVANGKTQIKVQDMISGKENMVLVYVLGNGNIESNGFSNIALKSNGEVWSYGLNSNGELGTGDTIDKNIPTYTGINNIMQVALGSSHCLAVDFEGHVWAWGNNSNGQLGQGEDLSNTNSKVQVKSPDGQGVLENIVAVAAGDKFSMALDKNGTVYAWGDNAYGQLGTGNDNQYNLPQKVDTLENITNIYAKNSSSFAIDVDCKLWSCGYNDYGNLGLNNYTSVNEFKMVSAIDDVTRVVAGDANTTYVLTKDGDVYGFGNKANNSLLNVAGLEPQNLSTLATSLQRVYNIGAGYCTGYAITEDSKVVGWGLNNYSQLCYEDTNTQASPVYLKNIGGNEFENAVLVSGGEGSVQVVKSDGTVWSAGDNTYGQLGDGTNKSKAALENISPDYIKVDKNEVTLKLSDNSYKLNAKVAYGFNLLYEVNDKEKLEYFSTNTEIASVDENGVITPNRIGRTYILIENTNLQIYKRVIVNVIANEKVTKEKVESGYNTTIALKQDGTVWAFGSNNYGQIGNDEASNQYVYEPTRIEKCKYLQSTEIVNEDGSTMTTTAETEKEFKDIIDISAGETHNLAVDINGTVWAWGNNGNGQLGDGTTNNHYVPYRVEGLSNIIKVQTNANKSYALTTTGEVYAWGSGYTATPEKITFGKKVSQLTKEIMLCEDGTVYRIEKNPVKINGFNNVVQIASYLNNYAALDNMGNVWTCGDNSYGQLGLGDITNHATIEKVKVDSEIIEIYYGTNTLELLDVEGNVYTCGANVTCYQYWWGTANDNDLGRLGLGINDYYISKPTKVENLQKVKNINSQYGNSVVSDKNGVIYTTGDNRNKQLGDNVTDSYRLDFQPIENKYVSVNTKNVTLGINDTYQLEAIVYNSLNLITDIVDLDNIEYISLNTDIVSVESNGLIKGEEVGTAEIIVKHTISGEQTVVFVKVTQNDKVAVPKVVEGNDYTVSLKSDGTVWTWGTNGSGQLGTGNTQTQILPVRVQNLDNVIDIVAGTDYTFVLKSDGTVWTFGNGSYGILGNGSGASSIVPVQVITNEGNALNKIVKIATKGYKAVALDEDGKVWNWGYTYGAYAIKSNQYEKVLDISANYVVNSNGEVIKTDSNTKLESSDVIRVSEGVDHALFLSKSGRGYAYGNNSKGQLGVGNTINATILKPIVDSTGKQPLVGIKQISAGNQFSIAVLDNNETYIWGSNDNYKLCSEQTANQVLPREINDLEQAMGCFAGLNNAGIIDIKGFVYTWGLGEYGNIGNETYNSSAVPVLVGRKELELNSYDVKIHSNEEYQLVASNGTFNLLKEVVEEMNVAYTASNISIATVSEDGKIKGLNTGKTAIVVNKQGTTIDNIVNVTVLPENIEIEPMVVTSDSHTIILKADGTVWAYGNNDDNTIGNGTANASDSPVKINFPYYNSQEVKIKQIATGNDHVLALDTNGNVWGWGVNTDGCLGFTSRTPVKTNLSNIKKVVAHNNQSMVITNDGFVLTWGNNKNGELGLGTYQNITTPTLVSNVSDIIDGSFGDNHTVLLTKNGKVLTTGLNIYGQTGKSTGKSNKFEELTVEEKICKVEAGNNHTALLSTGASVYAFGDNNNGQLGNGTTQNITTPTKVIDGIMDISAGKDYTMILASDKNLYSTGCNGCGELGNGKDNKLVFTKVDDISNVMNFDCGDTYSTAITYDGNVYGWGNYYHGIQKVKTKTNSTIPTNISNENCYTQTPELTVNIESNQQIEMANRFIFNVFNPNIVCGEYTYESLNPEIATVNITGGITGVSVGKTCIKVTEQNTNKVSIIIVNVITKDGKVAPMVEGGNDYTVVLKSSGDIWSYGYNQDGQLGFEQLVSTNLPNQINVLASYKKIDAGERFAVALRDDGTVWAWGDNTYGQLGQGNRISAQKPIQVQELDSIIDIAVGNNHVIALDKAGNMYAWGLNNCGQLGTGDTVTATLPTKVIGVSNNILDISAGENSTAIVDASGNVYVFGSNENEKIAKYEYNIDKYGQKIVPAKNEYYVKPQRLHGIEDAVKVECGDNGVIVLDSNQQVDQIVKYGSQSMTNVVSIASNKIDFSARKNNVMLLDKNGKIFSYGDNTKGQAGVGLKSKSVETSQATIENVEKFISVGCGNDNNYVIDEKGHVYSAGSNRYGQIGNASFEDSSIFKITIDNLFEVSPEAKIMVQPEKETVAISSNLFNVFNIDEEDEMQNYILESNNPEIVNVEDGAVLSAENTGEATISVTNKLTGATKNILRVVQPLDEDRIETIEINGVTADVAGLLTYRVSVASDENGKGTLVVTAKNETDTIEIDGTSSVGTISKEIELDIENKTVIIKVTASNGNSIEYVLNVNVLSQDTSLKEIKIGEIQATVTGDSTYEIIIGNEIEEEEVLAIATNENTQINIDSGITEKAQSTKSINMTGKNKKVIPIVVEAEGGDKKVYELTIYKEDGLTVLDTLTINGVHAMKIDENTYKTIIKNDVETAEIVATTLYKTAQIHIAEDETQIYTANKIIETTEDEITVKIYVSAKGIDREITLVITKEKELDKLNILKVTADTEELIQMGGIYIAQVKADVTNVEIVVTTENITDLVSIGDDEASVNIATKSINLLIGQGATETITVTDSLNSTNTKEYKLVIKRPNSDTTLKSLSVQNNEISKQAVFENGTNNYKVGISEEYNKINVTAVAGSDTSKVSINGSDFESDTQTLEVEVLDNPTQVTICVIAADGSIQEYRLYIRKQSANALLDTIFVDGNEATVSENSEGEYEVIYEYYLSSIEETVLVNAIANDENALIKIDSNDNKKKETSETVEIVDKTTSVIAEITAENGKVKQYKLLIHALSDNTEIKTVQLNEKELVNMPINQFNGKVNKNDESFDLYIATQDEKAKIKVDDNQPVEGNIHLSIPKNEPQQLIKVKIISQIGSEEDYTIMVTNQSDNCGLLNIKVDGENAELDKEENYCINVVGITQNVDVTVDTSNEFAKVKINGVESSLSNIDISNRTNEVEIEVIAEDGTTKSYNLIITKLSNEVGASVSVVYSNQEENGDITEDVRPITIDENGKGTIKINEADSTVIRVITDDKNAKIEITGNETVVNTKDAIISTTEQITTTQIKVIAEDGTIKQYEIELVKNSDSNQLLSLSIDGIESTDIIKTSENTYTAKIPNTMSKVNVSVLASELTKIQIGDNVYSEANSDTEEIQIRDEQQIVTINVKSESGEVNTYELKIVKVTDLSLTSVKVDNEETTLENKTFMSSINTNTQSVEVKITPANENVLISTKQGNSEYTEATSASLHTITVPITSNQTLVYVKIVDYLNDSRINEYIINIEKESNNSEIVRIKVNGNNVVREEDSFKLDLPMDISNINVMVEPYNKNASVKIGESNPSVGTSESIVDLSSSKMVTVPITIISQDGTSTNTYNLIINRKSVNTECSVLINSEESDVIEIDEETQAKSFVKYVASNTTGAEVQVTTNDESSKIDILGETFDKTVTKTLAINEPETRLSFDVISENGNKETYIVLVVKNSSDAELESLKVNNYLAIKNEEGIYEVDIIEELTLNQEVEIEAVTSNKRANVKIGDDQYAQNVVAGIQTLSNETKVTTFKITVQPQDLSVQPEVYTLKVNKISTDTKVKTVMTGSTEITDYDSDTNTYRYYVGNDVTELPISVETANEAASIKYGDTINDNIMNIESVSIGTETSKIITFTVISEAGSSEQYNIEILRHSDNTDITKVFIDTTEITNLFTGNNATVLIDKNVISATIRVIVFDKYATIKIGDAEPEVYESIKTVQIEATAKKLIVPIIVTAQDGTTQKQYNIILNRKSDNILISSLQVDGEVLAPVADGEYETTLKYDKTLASVNIETEFSLATIKLDSQTEVGELRTNLMLNKDSDTVKNIIITAQDGTSKTYTLTIHKSPNELGLKSIVVNDMEVTDKQADGTYKIITPLGTTQAVIQATTLVDTSKVKISDTEFVVSTVQKVKELTEDYTTVDIVVQTQDNNQATYRLLIQKMESTLSSDTSCEILVNNEDVEEIENENGTYTKYVNHADEKATIKITTTNENASIIIDGKETVHQLEQEVTLTGDITEQQVVVKSENQIEKLYKVRIVRKSDNNNLDEIRVDDQVIIPNEDGKYVTYVSDNNEATQLVRIQAKTQEEHAEIQIGDGTQWYTNIATGNETFTGTTRQIKININVYSHNGSMVTKELVINRVSSNLGIDSLKVNDSEVTEYNAETYTFTAQIKNDVNQVSIIAETSSAYSKIVVDGQESIGTATLGRIDIQGTQTITKIFKVIAEDGSEQEYTLVINRMSADCSLQHLYLNDEDIIEDFIDVESVPTVNISIEKLEQIMKIEAQANNENANIHIGDTESGLGNILRTLQLDTSVNTIIVPIVVTSQDEVYVKTYNIIFTRLSNNTKIATMKVDGNVLIPNEEGNYETSIKASSEEAQIDILLDDNCTKAEIDGVSGTGHLIVTAPVESIETIVKQIKIIAQDGTEREITLTIHKLINNLNLSKVYVDNRIAKKVSYNTYQIDVVKGTTSVNIKAIAEKNTEYVSIMNNTKVESQNIYTNCSTESKPITIKVTAMFGTVEIDEEKEYILIINEVETSKDLEDLKVTIKVDGEVIIPDADGTYIKYVEPKLDTAIVWAGISSETSKVKISDSIGTTSYTSTEIQKNINLQNETTQVIVTAQNGALEEQEYVVNIVKEPTGIFGKVITQATNQENQSAVITLYKTSDTRPETSENLEEGTEVREPVSQVNISDNGEFFIKITETGTYDIVISKISYLEYRITNISVEYGTDVTLEDVRIYAGDIIKSGEIEISDLVALNSNYGLVTESNIDDKGKYDLNEDGIINSVDRDILKANYSKISIVEKWINPLGEVLTNTQSINIQNVDNSQEELTSTTQSNEYSFGKPIDCSYLITSEYGERVHPITGETKFHTGIDITGIWHTAILAAADGEVTYAGEQGTYGNCIEIKHNINEKVIYTLYAHLSQIVVSVGQIVKQGETIGIEGGAESDPNHGSSTGHHLHFEIRNEDEECINPNNYIEF